MCIIIIIIIIICYMSWHAARRGYRSLLRRKWEEF